jgi:MYXO-CTERM domain-containing protein
LKFRLLLGFIAALTLMAGAAFAQGPNVLISIDENGNGFLNFGGGNIRMPWAVQNDPGPGGLPNVLTYNMLGPPSVTAGDVLLQDGVGGPVFDVVRFNDYNTGGVQGYPASILFYSDNTDGFDSIGDTPSPPGAFYANNLTIQEIGPEGLNGAVYTPLAGQPGFVPGFNVTYDLVSDGVITPEPPAAATFAFGAFGLIALVVATRRRRQLSN